MSSFKPSQSQIKTEEAAPDEVRVVKLDTTQKREVQDFKMGNLRKPGDRSYASVKARFGPLAATDPERVARSQKDARFTLNPLLRDPLSVEEEERRAIEERVRVRVQAIEEDAKAKAAKAGYDEGLKKGFDEAYRKFQEEGAGRLRQFDQFLQACDGAKDEIFRANERYLIDLVFRVARMVLLKDLSADRDYVLRLAKELLERIGVRENITVRVHPNEMATAGMLREGLEKALGQLKNLNIEGSPQVQQGGCMIETEWNAIDASVETQLKGIHDALVGKG
jgi:flagellar assembly protein FliH